MLRTMTAEQYDEWVAYYRLEPFGVEMWDWLLAHFKALFANANRDPKKNKRGYKPDRFLCFSGHRQFEVMDIRDGIEDGTDGLQNQEESDTTR